MHSIKNIVIVEDDAISALVLKRNLQKWGFQVSGVFATAEEFLAEIVQLSVDLILMDIMLAGKMTGVDAVEHIHRQKDIPVIYITASEDPETKRKIEQTNYFKIISKPYQPQQVENAIVEFMHR